MNVMKKKPGTLRENIDTLFWGNLGKLEGKNGIDILPNDNPDIISRLIKALKDRDGLPEDLNNPETEVRAEAVNQYALDIYYLFCEGAEIAESMMVGAQVEKTCEDAMDEKGETMSDYDKLVEAGHKESDF